MLLSRRLGLALAALLIISFQQPAWAAGGGGGSDSSTSPPASASVPAEYSKAKKLIQGGNYADAIPLLEKAAGKAPRNPDVFNLLGFSNRKLRRFDVAEKHYGRALELNAKHKGALEYLGELYLQTGRTDKAREMLKRLSSACVFGCKEYDQLKKAIASGPGANW